MFERIDRDTENELIDEIDTGRVEDDVDTFAGLRRYPGSDDQWQAAEYIVDTLSDAGVDVEMETIDAYTSVPESAAVSITGPVHREIDDAITTAFSANTPAHGISGEIVAVESVGDGSSLPDVQDTIVFTRGLPTPATVQTLDQAGAVAAVFQSPTEGYLHEMIASPVWGTPSVDNYEQLPDVPVVEIHQSDGEWLDERLAGERLQATVKTDVRTEVRELPCPIAKIEGTHSDRYFVVGNHIDSWHEGVTDNGTAVAASMELARVFAESPPKRGVLIGFWPGHSMGRYAGSARYADQNWLDLRENGVAYLHIDLNGLDGADQLWFQHMSEVADEHLDVLSQSSVPLKSQESGDDGGLIGTSDRPGRNSDQSFWGAGLSSLLSGARFSSSHPDSGPVGGGWWWHTPADTRDKVDFELLLEEIQLYTAIVSRFCNSAVLPHDFRETATEIREIVTEIETAAGETVDFEPVYDRLDELEASLAEFTAVVDNADGNGIDTEIEDVQVRVGNLLIPVLYMEASETEHDPALPTERLPALRVAEELPERSGPQELFATVTVEREVSRLASRIDEATATVESFLKSR